MTKFEVSDITLDPDYAPPAYEVADKYWEQAETTADPAAVPDSWDVPNDESPDDYPSNKVLGWPT